MTKKSISSISTHNETTRQKAEHEHTFDLDGKMILREKLVKALIINKLVI